MLGSKQHCAGATLCSYYLCGIQMNANELADRIEKSPYAEYKSAKEAATMLRQQQEEIKDLKQQVAFLEDWRDTWRPFLKTIMEKVNEK
jgi:hypothetical protein